MPYTQIFSTDSRVMPDLVDYMTTQEAAKKLGYHIESIRRMLRDKELEGIKWRRDWLVLRSSVEEYSIKTAGMEKFDPRRGN